MRETQGMVEVLLFVNIGLLVIGSVTLTIAIFVMQKAQSYVDIAEQRMERLRLGQERLFDFVREIQLSRSAASLDEESAVSKGHQRAVAEDVVQTVAGRTVDQQTIRRTRHGRAGSNSASDAGGTIEGPANDVTLAEERASEVVDSERGPGTSSTTNSPKEASAAGSKEVPEAVKSGFAVRHAHPDDDISLQRKSEKRESSSGVAPVKMFREHYHRYLENYEGYVRLAERLCKMREDGEVAKGTPAESEWQQKLHRLNDGIHRTTARLDILEQYNPELASDDRVSHRAQIAQSYSELENKLSALETS
ncbi:hypothetical protein BH23ACT11_BH23ACT11_20460 [soil metagenome]